LREGSESLEFEWNPAKAKANLRKHRLSFHDAGTVAMMERGGLVVVAHLEKGRRTPIIRARSATRRERRFHEQR
jgi:hypothetical protein